MDNRLIMENYLLVLKSTVEVFVHGTLESANEVVKETLKDGLNTIITSQKETFSLMMKYGWYPINNVKVNQIRDTLNKLESSN